ncbi:hypothetical protein BDV93DRAFT_527895 [Ceratobasidium sp. AG-I]|nr:hypothetical protein BDV93DRAFT_527895 [Ceratobasidium sp. AG-I]
MNLAHKLVLFLATALTLVLASPTFDPSTGGLLARASGGVNLTCASHASKDAIAASQSNIALFASSHSDKPKQINVYWHVVYLDKTFIGGYLSDDQIHKQIKVLNTHFRSSDISFKLVEIDRTLNSEWFGLVTDTNSLGRDMKEALHKGDHKDLNIYSVRFQGDDLSGFSTWPWDVVPALKLDGVILQWDTIPGGPSSSYNQGKILVHQVGHWCGLYHTFEGGCGTPGDFVSDTPKQEFGHFGCPRGADTCPGGGKDPINNFMDFTNDQCKTQFTKGQGARMRLILALWRS